MTTCRWGMLISKNKTPATALKRHTSSSRAQPHIVALCPFAWNLLPVLASYPVSHPFQRPDTVCTDDAACPKIYETGFSSPSHRLAAGDQSFGRWGARVADYSSSIAVRRMVSAGLLHHLEFTSFASRVTPTNHRSTHLVLRRPVQQSSHYYQRY